MHIDDSEGLLLASLTISYDGRTKTINRIAIAAGAEHTIIISDVVADLGIAYKNGDRHNGSQGIGGAVYAFEKIVEHAWFCGFQMHHTTIDFGQIDWDINGLIGRDILATDRFAIDRDPWRCIGRATDNGCGSSELLVT